MDEFLIFLKNYQAAWNSLDVEQVMSYYHTDFQARWVYPMPTPTGEWGYEGMRRGWTAAYQNYGERNPRWCFEDVMVTPISEQEMLAVYWVTFEIEGALTQYRNFFVDTYQHEGDVWKKVHEFCQSNLPRE